MSHSFFIFCLEHISSFRKAFLFFSKLRFCRSPSSSSFYILPSTFFILYSSFFIFLSSAIRGSGFGRSGLGTSAHFGSEGKPVPSVIGFGDGWRRINIIGRTCAETWRADEPAAGATTSAASAARTVTAPTAATASTARGSCVAIRQLSGIERKDG